MPNPLAAGRSIEALPGSVAHANRAMAHLKLGRLREAERDCTAALELDHLYLKAWQRRATARRAQGRLPEAVADYEEALRRARLAISSLRQPWPGPSR